jgi:chemotaxis response regulator CheB
MIRVVIADDHGVLRDGLAGVISAQADMQLAGTAANGAEAVELCRSEAPEVVLMDIEMPVIDGIEATKAIVADMPGTAVLILTSFSDRVAAVCCKGVRSELRLKPANGSIEVRFELRRGRASSWRDVLVQERRIAWKGTQRTSGRAERSSCGGRSPTWRAPTSSPRRRGAPRASCAGRTRRCRTCRGRAAPRRRTRACGAWRMRTRAAPRSTACARSRERPDSRGRSGTGAARSRR